jgi:hypothetical protein
VANPLWITHAWVDNDEGDFDFLIQELHKAGVPANYDKVALVPGRKLWTQIAARISTDSLSGWAYLITPNSLSSAPCQEELSYALQRALETRGSEFPLIGLLNGVSIRDVPLPLRVRLCVNLANPDWIEEIRAAVAGTPPRRAGPPQEPFVIKYHRDYLSQTGKIAIEIRPRFGEIRYWRWAFPSTGPQPVAWGTGPANGGGVGAILQESLEGEYHNIAGTPMKFIGAGNPISSSSSAYAVFDQKLPERFFFGVAKEPFGTEANGNLFVVG